MTFTGSDLDAMGHDGPDQRIKVYIPLPGEAVPHLTATDWYANYRDADPATRGAIRTYTIGAVRPEHREVDIDFVLHGETGPASSWATHAQIGDEVALIGPNRRFGADCQGHEWNPPAAARTVLIAGDETAVPAITGILHSMSSWRRLPERVHVVLEVPQPGDVIDLPMPEGVNVEWLIRDSHNRPSGELLVDAVRRLDLGSPSVTKKSTVDTIDIDLQLLWEVADGQADDAGFYAWVAGEAGAVKAIRRHLVNDCGIDRRCVAFMGYWRLGRSEEN